MFTVRAGSVCARFKPCSFRALTAGVSGIRFGSINCSDWLLCGKKLTTLASTISGEVDKTEVWENGVPVKVDGRNSAHSFVPGSMPLRSIVTDFCRDAAALEPFLDISGLATSGRSIISGTLSTCLGAGVGEDEL